MIFCPNCGAQQPDGSVFCGSCGTKLAAPTQKRICPHCNHELAANMMFCDQCGSRYTEPSNNDPYTPPYTPPTSSPVQSPAPAYSNDHTDKLVMNTGSLTVLSVICIFLCWPVGVYGFYCRRHANNASSQEEANNAIRRGTRACFIAMGVMAALFMIGILAGA